MEFDLTFFALAIPAMIFSGISKAGFGSGASFAGAALLALVLEPALALGITLPLFMLVDVAALPSFWKRWSWPEVRLIIWGSLPGVALGVWLYQIANADVFRVMLGGISLAFVAWQALRSLNIINHTQSGAGKATGIIAGIVAGFTSFVSHAGGPAVAVYLLSKDMDKTTYNASSVLVFWAINIFKFVPYTILGIFTYQTMLAGLYLAPFILFGAWIGIKAHFLVPERLFFALTYVMLVGTGVKLLWDGLGFGI